MDEQQAIDAWKDAEQRYQPGQQVWGVVTRVTHFGVFARVEPGLEGVIYAFEIGNGPTALAAFVPGQEVTLYVSAIDASRKRLELSLQNNLTPGLLGPPALPPEIRAHRSASGGTQSWPPLLPPPDLTLKSEDASQASCPACQRAIQTGWKFCVYCGRSLQRRCAACGTLQPDLPDARYCCECGQAL